MSDHIFNIAENKINRASLRKRMTASELILWKRIRGKQLNNIKFRRQFGIGKFIVDFYSTELKLAIEVDGDSHYSNLGLKHDKELGIILNDLGIKILRFTNKEVIENIDGVLHKILENTPSSSPLAGGEQHSS